MVPPEKISTLFLGIFDVTQKSALLAAFAGISQLLQAQFMKMPTPSNNGDKPSFGSDFAKSLSFQMKYLFPIIIVFIAYALPGSVALYWITSNLFSVGQEIYLRRHQS